MRPRLKHNFKRLLKLSVQNTERNLLLSVATTVMMGLILFIFNVIMVLNVLAQASIGAVNEKVDLILYVDDEIELTEVDSLLTELRSLEMVTQVSYTSKEQALEEFLTLYPDKAEAVSSFSIENPLPSSIQVLTKEPEQHELVVDYLRNSDYTEHLLDIESARENQAIVDRLVRVTNFTRTLIVGVIVTFVFGSLLIIVNAIHLSIFTRKREIQIMQLVGAPPHMIRLPFLAEGALYSTVAVIFSFILLILFIEGSNLTSFEIFNQKFHPATLLLLELVGSLIIGLGSSAFALNYYLKRTLVLESS